MAVSSRNMTRDEMRAQQAALTDNFVATNSIYGSLRERIYDPNLSAVDCAKLYVDQTIALAADSRGPRELWQFVEIIGASMVELASRIHHGDDATRTKLVDFIYELQKAVIKDPNSLTGEPLHFYEERESVLWRDLPEFWLACAEERIGFSESLPCGVRAITIQTYVLDRRRD